MPTNARNRLTSGETTERIEMALRDLTTNVVKQLASATDPSKPNDKFFRNGIELISIKLGIKDLVTFDLTIAGPKPGAAATAAPA